MTTEAANMMSNETLRTFARFGQDLETMTYNQRIRAGLARHTLAKRDATEATA